MSDRGPKVGQSAGKGRGPTKRSVRWKKSSSKTFVTKRYIDGGEIKMPPNPPQVTYQPWNKVTLVKAASAKWDPKVQDLLSVMRKQLDPTQRGFNQVESGDKRFVIQFKIQRIRAWNLTGRTIALSVTDITDAKPAQGGREQLCGLVDTGTETHTPAVGFTYPVSTRAEVVRADDITGGDNLFIVQGGSGDQLMIYVDVFYRFDGPVTPPQLLLPFAKLNSTASKQLNATVQSRDGILEMGTLIKELKELNLSMKTLAEKAEKEKPSTLSKIIDGGVKTAMLVSAIAAQEFQEESSPGSSWDGCPDV